MMHRSVFGKMYLAFEAIGERENPNDRRHNVENVKSR